jgi:hypothetical protein
LIEHPNATASLVVRQPNWQSYPATVTLNGMTLEWLITDAEIGLQSGTGEIQITVADGEQIYKSAIAQTVILPSILYKSGSIPDPIAHWISQAQAELEKTKEALNTAQNFIADLKQKLDNGELNGKPGPQGEKGEKGDPGKDAPQEAVLYTAQTLDDAQKAQARENIGAADEEIVDQLKDDIGDLNKLSQKLSSVSVIHECNVSDERYWNFISDKGEVEEVNKNYVAVKIPVVGNNLIVYGEFQDWASRYVVDNNVFIPTENTYIQHNTQGYKVSEFNNIPADAKYLCLSFYKGGADTSIESINVVYGKFEQNVSYRKTDFIDRLNVYTKEEIDEKIKNSVKTTKLYVSTTGDDTTGDGSKSNPYATLLKANDMVTDNSEYHKYEIIVADGTYTDMQEKYKGQNGSDYQGVIAKSYVTYKSESDNPEKCIFIWDGGVGYDVVTDSTCTNKCFFHVNSITVDTVIKGFKFIGTNLRYCLHFESNCLSTPTIENCIFDWHGRTYINNGPVIGMGGSLFSHITFKDCKFLNSQSDAGIQWHDNTYPYDWMNGRYEPEGLCPRGAVIECIDCLFDNLNIQVRSQNEDRPMPCCLVLRNCGGLKNVYPTCISGGTKNYWRLLNQCSFITNDLLSSSDDNTTYDEMIEPKKS